MSRIERKAVYFSELSNNQQRLSIDIRQTYEAYREARRNAAKYAGGLSWKTVGGREYLIKILNRSGGTRSLGPRSGETEAIHAEFVAGKARAKEREAALGQSLREFAGMARGIHLNRVPAVVTATLRKLDEYHLLGRNLMVIGTNAMYGYEAVGGVMFDAGLLATTDMDLLWDARSRLKLGQLDDEVAEAGLLAILRKVDRSFEAVGKGGFRAANKDGFHVDLVKQTPNLPWKQGEPEQIAAGDLTASWLPNIKWLLASEKFQSIVIGQDGLPAPMVSPDPRAFAIYKHWLGEQPDREPGKKQRDQQQAEATIVLLREKLPHLALDERAQQMFPKALRAGLGGQLFDL
jgi:hypothetical protein